METLTVNTNDGFRSTDWSQDTIWLDSLAIPSYFACASALILLLQLLLAYIVSSETFLEETDENATADSTGLLANAKNYVKLRGGPVIFAYKVARLLGSLVFLGLSLSTLLVHEDEATEFLMGDGFLVSRRLADDEWLQIAMCITCMYISLLAFLSVSFLRKRSAIVTKHLVLLLTVTWMVYFYRDLWPLATYLEIPRDQSKGWLLWSKTVVLTLIAIVIPLIIPRQYVPLDPTEPMEPNPEQTASILSLVLWSFLDSVIFMAYKTTHLSHSQLPPLADYDHSKNLVKRSFKHLDRFSGAKRSHLFWGLMRVFHREYLAAALMIVVRSICGLANPIALNRLLNYMEHQGEGAVVRPWVWIMALFLGPLINSLAMQWYFHLMFRVVVQAEAFVTQLVFEHSLRIRMVAGVPESSANSPETPPNDTSISGQTSEDETENDSGDDTLQASSASASSSTSPKQKPSTEEPVKGVSSEKEPSSTQNLVGKINNLVSSDLANITEARDFLAVGIFAPLQVILSTLFLYNVLGWSAFVGLATMACLFPVPGYIGKAMHGVQSEVMKKMDARVQAVTETVSVIRMVKLFGWEMQMSEKMDKKREAELAWVWKRKILSLLVEISGEMIPAITMIVTFMIFTMVMKGELDASRVFSAMAAFQILRHQLYMVVFMVPEVIQGKVSLDRLDEFLMNSELLDAFADSPQSSVMANEAENGKTDIGFRDASFSWFNRGTSDGTLTPSQRYFTLRIEDELLFQPGVINLITGPTASGKTSLLMALLGEMHFMPSGPMSWFNLPRAGGVAYAAQESWIQNDTIRENILFGSPYDEARYNEVIYQCALERDLNLFDAGDRTEVGEKGLTLSGGQKARLTLARAVYSSAQILLLDDVLAALDVHTAKWIVNKCFSGSLISGRTVLLVTHNVVMASTVAKFIVSLGLDGRVISQGPVSSALAQGDIVLLETEQDRNTTSGTELEVHNVIEPGVVNEQASGKLMAAEEIAEGHVSWPALKFFIYSLGGIGFWVFLLGGMLAHSLTDASQVWYLGHWASKYEEVPASEISVPHYISIFALLLFATNCLYVAYETVYVYGSLKASRKIHKALVDAVLGTTLRWIDQTPTSRMTARFTQDIRAVDGPVSDYLDALIQVTISMVVKFGAVIVFTPVFIVFGIVTTIVGGGVGQIYMKAQLCVKREMSNAKSPVLGHFGAAVAGLISIRAYGAQSSFKAESLVRIDRYTRAARTFWDLNRWVTVRIDALGGLFAGCLAAYLIYGPGTIGASNAGFSLTMAVGFSTMILWWVRVFNEFEVSGNRLENSNILRRKIFDHIVNSLERIQGYVTIEQEPKPHEGGIPPAYWPASGDLRVEGLSARYSTGGPEVLHGLSFHIKSGERVGIVGRTGSGKSSLTLSLLRCILTEGTVYFDGIPTSSLNLDVLRSNITIIPQIPELLSGTLRQNLDPLSQYDDATLNSALRAAGLNTVHKEDSDRTITLDSTISGAGANLSVGERQILALARAMVRGSKLLILDEATSAIDFETDTVIQSSLRHELKGDVTILTVAHRLQTIMDADKIMVLDAGHIVEFDSPSALLKNEQGMLRALVDESGDKDMLYAMAFGEVEV